MSSFPDPELKELDFGPGWQVVLGGWLLGWALGTFWALGAWALQQREEAASDSGFAVCRALPFGAGPGSGRVGRPTSHMRKLRPGEVEVASSGCLRALEFCRGPEPGYVG